MGPYHEHHQHQGTATGIPPGTAPFYAVCIAYFAVINFVFCPYEEQKLQAAFGKEFLAYQWQVRRWL